jgi:Signal transduction histidine kinase
MEAPMDSNRLKLLMISRYFTYIVVFISSILIIEKDLGSVAIFSLLFILVLINSYLRISIFENKTLPFMISALVETALIAYMQSSFNSIAVIWLYIIIVDLYLELKFSHALLMTIPVYAAILYSFLPRTGRVDFGNLFINIAVNTGVLTFFGGAAYVIRHELNRRSKVQRLYEELKKSKEEIEEANKKLVEYAKKVEDVAVLNERNRLAGEIHDTIGHNLTALIMEIDICSKLLDRDLGKARVELEKASGLARDALSEVRRSVRAIKPQNMENHTGVRAIEDLLREFEKNTRIIVKLNVSKSQYSLSPTVEVTLYRTIQEALTNCARYGQADIITVNLDFKEKTVELSIRDNGNGCVDFSKGVGLTTMEERIQSLGGSIYFSGNNGFTINVVIPVEV